MPEDIVLVVVIAIICAVVFIVVFVMPMLISHFWRNVCTGAVEILWFFLGGETTLLGSVTKAGAINSCYAL